MGEIEPQQWDANEKKQIHVQNQKQHPILKTQSYFKKAQIKFSPNQSFEPKRTTYQQW